MRSGSRLDDPALEDMEAWIRGELGPAESFKGAGYLREYVRVLGDELASMSFVVELGVAEGASLLAWSRLCPEAHLLGVDLEPAPRLVAAIERLGIRDRIRLLTSDHGDVGRIGAAIDGPVDLIVDDGSHRREPARRCFFGLFDRLRPGAWYSIEDRGAGYWESYGGSHGGVHRLPGRDCERGPREAGAGR